MEPNKRVFPAVTIKKVEKIAPDSPDLHYWVEYSKGVYTLRVFIPNNDDANPKTLCFEFTIKLNADKTFEVQKFDFFECEFKKVRSFSHLELQEFFLGKNKDLPKEVKGVLKRGYAISSSFSEKRTAKNKTLVYNEHTGTRFSVNEYGQLVLIHKDQYHSYVLNQELLTLVGSEVANLAMEKGIPLFFANLLINDKKSPDPDFIYGELSGLSLNPERSNLAHKRFWQFFQSPKHVIYNSSQKKDLINWVLGLTSYAHVAFPGGHPLAISINYSNLLSFKRKEAYRFPKEKLLELLEEVNDWKPKILSCDFRRKEDEPQGIRVSTPVSQIPEPVDEIKKPFVLLKVKGNNYLQALEESCKRAGIDPPKFKNQIVEHFEPPLNMPMGTVSIGEKQFLGGAVKADEKSARQSAAKRLYDQIQTWLTEKESQKSQ